MGSAAMRPKCLLFLVIALTWLPSVLVAAHEVAAHKAEEGEFHGHAEGEEHGHVHEGGHGHGHEEGHGHSDPSEAMVTTSFLLIGFLVTNFVMIGLVNWPDPHVRSSIWKMISGTVSIYLAVLIINSVSSFVLWTVTGEVEGSENVGVDLALRSSIFVFCFVIGNLLIYFFREWPKLLYATQVIGAHIVAFAGIGAFHVVTEMNERQKAVCSGAAVVVVILILLRVVSKTVRVLKFGSEGEGHTGYHQLFERLSQKRYLKHSKDSWRHAVCEAEDDACSIALSYVIKELVIMYLFERRKEQLFHEHGWSDIKLLLIAQGVSILSIVALTYLRKSLDTKFQEEASNPVSLYSRTLTSMQIVVAMTMSWLSLYLFFWITNDMFPMLGHKFVELISAAFLTITAIIGVLVIDKFADKVDELEKNLQDNTTVDDTESSTVTGVATALIRGSSKEDAPSSTASNLGQEAMTKLLNLQNFEKALRMLIESFALAVGLAWEKAFHAALETVVETFPITNRHRVISSFSMAFFSCVLMLPIWSKFIVPMAQRPIEVFQKHIELDQDMIKFE